MIEQIKEIEYAMDQLAYTLITQIENEDTKDAYLTILSTARIAMMQLETKLMEKK